MSYVSFTSRLKTTMEGVSSLKAVYDYEPKTSGFPFCSIVPVDNGSEVTQDSCSNETTYSFRILVVDDMADASTDRDTVESRMRSVADEVLGALHVKNLFKPEGALTHVAKNIGFKYIERESGYARAYEVIVEIRKLQSLS